MIPLKNKFEIDYNKNDFIKMMGQGYIEDWFHYPYNAELQLVHVCLVPYYNNNHLAMELGCGGGFWTTKYLSPNFKTVYALDVIPKTFTLTPNINYIELSDNDYYCTGIENNNIDFVWSFGMFCHLSLDACEEYLKNIYLKLKPGGKAVLMFGNWENHPNVCNIKVENKNMNVGSWYYNNKNLTLQMIKKCNYKNIVDLIPDFRDSIFYIEK